MPPSREGSADVPVGSSVLDVNRAAAVGRVPSDRVPSARALVADLWLPTALTVLAVVETAMAGGDEAVPRTALAGLTAFGVVLRRHQPGLAAAWVAVGMAVESTATESPDQIGVLLAFLVAAFSAGGSTDRRDAVLGLGMLGLAVTVSIALDPSDSLSNVLPTLLLFVVVPAALGRGFAGRGRALERMGEANEALRREAAAAVDAERRRLSHELHDVVSHAVTLIAVTAEAGATVVRSDPGAAERSFTAIADTSRDALAELRALLALLSEETPVARSHRLADLDALVTGARAAGIEVLLVVPDELPVLSPEADLAAYRVAQEALTNALRHSRTPSVRIDVAASPSALRITVTSHGEPHRSSYGGAGRGLAGLRTRLEALGGSLEARPVDEESFVVAAEVPVGAP